MTRRRSIHDTPTHQLTTLADLREMSLEDRKKHASQEQFEAHPELFEEPDGQEG